VNPSRGKKDEGRMERCGATPRKDHGGRFRRKAQQKKGGTKKKLLNLSKKMKNKEGREKKRENDVTRKKN